MNRTPPPIEYDQGHPIRRFVFGILGAALVLIAIWWAGVFAPRISAAIDSGEYDVSNGRGVIRVSIDNEGPLAVELRSVVLEHPDAHVVSTAVNDQPISDKVTIPGHGSSQLVIGYELAPCELAGGMWTLRVSLDVESVSGAVSEFMVPGPGSVSTFPC